MNIRFKHRLMDENAEGSTGGGAPAAAAPDASPAAPAAPAAPVAPPVGDPPPPAPPAAWYDGIEDAGLKSWVQATGLPSPEQAAAKAWNLEKLLGADRAGRTITLPTDMSDMKQLEPIFAKLGRPESADGYKLDIPAGADPAFGKAAQSWFHDAQLLPSQATTLAGKWNEYMANAQTQAQQAEAEALRVEHEALARDWGTGPAADAQRERARRGAVKLGLDETAITALEKVTGFSKTMKALAEVGKLSGESEAVGMGEGESKFAMTPEQARGQKARLMADPEWAKKYLSGDHTARADMEKIDRVLSGGR